MNIPHKLQVRMLYKTVLRIHRGLPPEIRPLGDTYAKDEFKRHKNCSEPEAQVFILEWAKYALNLSKQLGLGIKGKPQSKIGDYTAPDIVNNLRDEQIVQLYELMKAAQGGEDENNLKDNNKIK